MKENFLPMRSWSSSAAFFCVPALMALHICLWEALNLTSEKPGALHDWIAARYDLVVIALKVFEAVTWLGITYFLSGARPIHSFAAKAGLSCKPTLSGWCCAWGAIGIALLDRCAGAKGLTSPVDHGFSEEGGWSLLLFVLFVVSLGPFFEEVVLRGYLYSAFRTSYGWLPSTLVILCVTAYFHKKAVLGSFWTPVFLGSLWALLCQVRERTPSVWNCVLCHAAYNATQVFLYPVWVMGMLLLLPICAAQRPKATIRNHSVAESPPNL